MFYLKDIKSRDNVFVLEHHKLELIQSYLNNNRIQILQQYLSVLYSLHWLTSSSWTL